MNAVSIAIEAAGGPIAVAAACKVSRQSVDKWLAKGSLPRTEYTGETHYADRIALLAAESGKPVEASWLLAEARPLKAHKNAA